MARETLAKTREVVDSISWVGLPKKFDIHEWQIMADFIATLDDQDLREELSRAIHGRGAFRYFKDLVRRHGIQDKWCEFKQHCLEQIAQDALEEANIPFQ